MIENYRWKLAGVIPAPLTPFTEGGKVDWKLLEKQLEYLVTAGADGLFVSGTTGEGAFLTTAEKAEILKAAKRIVAGRAFIAAACIQPSTPQVLEELEVLGRLEPDFVVAVAPYYYAVLQDAVREHFKAIARRSPVPLILYNIPQCTHNTIALDTVLELAREKNIAGIKDSSGDFVSFCRGLLADVPEHFSWIMGEDYLDGPAMLSGAHGIVTGLSNVWAGYHVGLVRAAQAGDREGVAKNHALIHELYGIHRVTGGKVIPALKAGAAFLGRSARWMKMTSLTMGDEDAARVRGVLEGLHLLP
jgi:4-hydroxy-tetrahydrodipicolinate synthase